MSDADVKVSPGVNMRVVVFVRVHAWLFTLGELPHVHASGKVRKGVGIRVGN